ncbi:MAG: hypothetical protein AAF404_20555 [Pseudomonadota bacterium]
MTKKYNTLILGASYGSLLGCKMALAGHPVTLVCTAPTAKLINDAGTVIRFPVRGLDEPVIVHSTNLPAATTTATPADVNVEDYDLVVLGMQEPQYSNPEVRDLLNRIALAKIPSMAIMNMPPLPYIKRLPGVNAESVTSCYAQPEVWDNFDPGLVTLASPDPQAFRPPDADKNVLQVSLPTNFKVARFESDEHTRMLRDIEADIIAARVQHNGEDTELPVKVKVHDSLYVPLAKWSMLMTGNYRCVQKDGMIAIRDAVHTDLDTSREIYDWTATVCQELGADIKDLVPFDKYANAAKGLSQPSSAAKALDRGVAAIERVDKLVHLLADQKRMKNPMVEEIVANVQWYLDKNSASA